MSRNCELTFRSDKVLIDDSISIKNSWSIWIKDNHTNNQRSDNAYSIGVGERKVNFFVLNVCIVQFYSKTLLISRFKTETLNERFNLKANSGDIFLNGIFNFKGLCCGLIFRAWKLGCSYLDIWSCGWDKVNLETLPVTCWGRIDIKM